LTASRILGAGITFSELDCFRWRFEPVLLDGKPVAAKAPMSMRVVASKRDDGNYNIGIRSAYFGQGKS